MIASFHYLTLNTTAQDTGSLPDPGPSIETTSPAAALAQAARDGSKGGLGVHDLEFAALGFAVSILALRSFEFGIQDTGFGTRGFWCRVSGCVICGFCLGAELQHPVGS